MILSIIVGFDGHTSIGHNHYFMDEYNKEYHSHVRIRLLGNNSHNSCNSDNYDSLHNVVTIDAATFANHVSHGYAMSVQQCQGFTFEKVLLTVHNSAVETVNTVYTVVTCSTKQCIVLAHSKEDMESILQRTTDVGSHISTLAPSFLSNLFY